MAREEGVKCEMSKISSKQTHFVLIHGLCGGGWCWFKIKCLLEQCYDYKVTCLDLRGCGIDPTDGNTIHSFDHYNQPLHDFMTALPDDDKVVLVGYSAGGLSVTKVLHKFPTKIQLAIYVAASMLKFGFQTPEDLIIGSPDFSKHGAEEPNKQTPTSSHFKPEDEETPKLFHLYNSLEEMTLLRMLTRPAPLKALLSSLEVTKSELEESEKIPRVYIKTKRDSVLKPKQQEAMILRWAPTMVYEIDSDHNPLLTCPLLLAGFLHKAVSILDP